MREDIRISIQDRQFRSADPKGHGSSGQIKTKAGSLFFARKVSVSLNGEEKILNKEELKALYMS